MVTRIYKANGLTRKSGFWINGRLTMTITLTMVIRMPAMAPMMASMQPPIAENIDPYNQIKVNIRIPLL